MQGQIPCSACWQCSAGFGGSGPRDAIWRSSWEAECKPTSPRLAPRYGSYTASLHLGARTEEPHLSLRKRVRVRGREAAASAFLYSLSTTASFWVHAAAEDTGWYRSTCVCVCGI